MTEVDLNSLPQVAPEIDLTALLEAGCHFGHQSKKWHPSMKKWIYGEKNGVHLFDLVKTASQLQVAYNYAYQLGKSGKVLVLVGTKRQARDIIKEAATRAKLPYIAARWLGGFLTNWEQVKKSLKKMVSIEEGLKSGKFDSYTKYERVQLEKEAGRLDRFFGGLRGITKEPDAIFVIDASREKVAVKEAVITGTPIMGIIDSNTDCRPVDVVIPANDDAVKSISLLVNTVVDGYLAGKNSK